MLFAPQMDIEICTRNDAGCKKRAAYTTEYNFLPPNFIRTKDPKCTKNAAFFLVFFIALPLCVLFTITSG